MTGSADVHAIAVQAVADRNGVARIATLRRTGVSRYRLDEALSAGRLLRVRRDWVAVPTADPHLIAAARGGVVISCVTAARRLGLWVLDDATVHVAAPPHGRGNKPSRALVHWAEPVIPRHPDALVDPVENALALVAVCRPFEEALAVWESALRQKVADALELSRLQLPARAREILAAANPFSDSGLESFVFPRLRWMKLRIVAQAWIAGHRVDFLIGERLVLQIDGRHHVGAQRRSDIEHDAKLMLLGYHVIRVSYEQVIHDWPAVQDVVMRAVAQGLHRAA